MSGRWLGWTTGLLLLRVLFLGLRSLGSFSLELDPQLHVVMREDVLWRGCCSESAVEAAALLLEDSLCDEAAEGSDRRIARRKVSRMAIVTGVDVFRQQAKEEEKRLEG